MTAAVPDIAKVETQIVEMTNAFRRENKLAAVTVDPALAAAAKAFADYLARTGTFSHTADGRQPAERIKASGYKACQVAENLALNKDSRGFEATELARRAVEGWKNSPGHRRNMLTETVTETGVGVVGGKDQTYIAVQLFGRPERLRYQFRVENLSSASIGFKFAGQQETLVPRMTIRFASCTPATLTLETARQQGSERRLDARYEPADGERFTITGDTLSSVRVERGN
jgi:hypothetical protein